MCSGGHRHRRLDAFYPVRGIKEKAEALYTDARQTASKNIATGSGEFATAALSF